MRRGGRGVSIACAASSAPVNPLFEPLSKNQSKCLFCLALRVDHAALVCENVTGMPYDRFAIEALFKPLGIEHWWFQFLTAGSCPRA